MNVLLTGGAGFIGSHLAAALRRRGDRVTVFDNLDPQAHPRPWKAPRDRGVRFVEGDVRDRAALARELPRADAVVHLAAAVGVGVSQYRIRHAVDVNVTGTATLLDVLANRRHRVRRVVLAGSMSSYGEGAYACRCGRVRPALRTSARRGRWDPPCPSCGRTPAPRPTREDDRLLGGSVYAVSKAAQEELVLTYSRAYGVPATALRFFNVYGPGQSLRNPYTGVAAIFVSRLKNGRPPVVYEDGRQTRDFVSVHDVVRACLRAVDSRRSGARVFNVGSGRPVEVADLARRLARLLGRDLPPRVTRTFRSGDVRHCFADLSAARAGLGYRPRVTLDDGLAELAEWSASADAGDAFDAAHAELARRGLA